MNVPSLVFSWFSFIYYVSFIFFMNAQREIRVNAFRLRFERMAAECDYLFYIITSLSLPWFFWMSHHRHFFDVLFFLLPVLFPSWSRKEKYLLTPFGTDSNVRLPNLVIYGYYYVTITSLVLMNLLSSVFPWFSLFYYDLFPPWDVWKLMAVKFDFFFFCIITSLLLYWFLWMFHHFLFYYASFI